MERMRPHTPKHTPKHIHTHSHTHSHTLYTHINILKYIHIHTRKHTNHYAVRPNREALRAHEPYTLHTNHKQCTHTHTHTRCTLNTYTKHAFSTHMLYMQHCDYVLTPHSFSTHLVLIEEFRVLEWILALLKWCCWIPR
jgi:hypothetical protein